MKNLLLEIKKAVDLAREKHNTLPSDKIQDFESRYDKILKAGLDEDYSKNVELYSKEKIKKSASLDLLNRLSGNRKQVLVFMYDFDIPFDNNSAERDLRIAKVK